MAKKKSRKTSGTSRGFRVALILLAVVAVAGIGVVRFLQTTRGAVFLVDNGVESAYPRVQGDVSIALKRSLERSGLRQRIRVRDDRVPEPGNVKPLRWDIPCDQDADLILINVALTAAVEQAGALVRRADESDDGRALTYHVGTRTRDTHRLTIRRLAPQAVVQHLRETRPLPRVAIVIDDFGYQRGGVVREILELKLPLSISILPGLRYSRAILDEARAQGRCVLLHLPMAGTGPEDPDLPPITPGMGDAEIASRVGEAMESLPGVDGVNNHQGSLATTDPRVMRAVCAALKPYDVFFLDSLTSAKSVAYTVALESGLRAASNTLFLDDATDRREDVEDRIRELIRIARKQGSAVGIGHPHPWTLEALRASIDVLDAAEIEIVTVCEMADTASAAAHRPARAAAGSR
jgi:polysaccharide deacetylase 2 family uncharacterized protein YibQ